MLRLTTLSHGGGCGCKIAPRLLSQILSHRLLAPSHGRLIAGSDGMDDAAVFDVSDDRLIVASTDFFTPIVDDAYDYGRIAAANALSDIYAMGAKPALALNILGVPLAELPPAVVTGILEGGAEVCRQADTIVAGGHSIDTAEPIYGLTVIGTAHPENIRKNSSAEAGDALLLGKPVGIGTLAAALKAGRLSDESYEEMLRWTLQLNRVGERFGRLEGVHAMTDVTGFGLLGHLSEICRASGLCGELYSDRVPFLESAKRCAKQGITTGAGKRNESAYTGSVDFDEAVQPWQRSLMFDPQTNGGLLLSCDSDAAAQVLAIFHECGFDLACRIGILQPGTPTSAAATIRVKAAL